MAPSGESIIGCLVTALQVLAIAKTVHASVFSEERGWIASLLSVPTSGTCNAKPVTVY